MSSISSMHSWETWSCGSSLLMPVPVFGGKLKFMLRDLLQEKGIHWVWKMSKNKVLCNYSHSRKTVNTRENFWNVYCFATNQKRDETAEDNRQTGAWISHDLIRNNELGLSSMTNLQFYRFQILKLFFFCISAYLCAKNRYEWYV